MVSRTEEHQLSKVHSKMGVLAPFLSSALLLAAAAQAAVVMVSPQQPEPAAATATYTGNPLEGMQMWPNRFYAEQVRQLALPRMSGEARRKAEKVAMVPSFMWL